MTDRLKLSDPKGDAEAAKIASALELAQNKRRIKELQKYLSDLESPATRKDQLEHRTSQSNNIGARESASLKAVSSAPSINLTPRGRGMVPVAYPTVQDLSTSIGVANTVRFNGDPVYLCDRSTQPACKGDEQGSGGGIRSGTVNGVVKPVKGSGTVNVEKKPVIRAGDPCTMNGGNNPGTYVTAPAPSSAPPKFAIETSNPPITLDTPQEQSAFDKWLDNTAENIRQALKHPVEGIKGAAKGLVNTVPATVELLLKAAAEQRATDLDDAAAIQTLLGQGAAAKTISDVAGETRAHADKINVPKLTMSNSAQDGGDTISTAVQIFAGGVGLLRSGAKWLKRLGNGGKATAGTKEIPVTAGVGKSAIGLVDESGAVGNGVKVLPRSSSTVPMNLAPGPVNFMKTNDQFFLNASRRVDIDPDGMFDVIAHGNQTHIELNLPPGAILVDAKVAAAQILRSKGYVGQDIRLLSCSTGGCEGGFAQQLANELGVNVRAPNDVLWATRSGQLHVSALRNTINPVTGHSQLEPEWPPTGKFIDFSPEK